MLENFSRSCSFKRAEGHVTGSHRHQARNRKNSDDGRHSQWSSTSKPLRFSSRAPSAYRDRYVPASPFGGAGQSSCSERSSLALVANHARVQLEPDLGDSLGKECHFYPQFRRCRHSLGHQPRAIEVPPCSVSRMSDFLKKRCWFR